MKIQNENQGLHIDQKFGVQGRIKTSTQKIGEIGRQNVQLATTTQENESLLLELGDTGVNCKTYMMNGV